MNIIEVKGLIEKAKRSLEAAKELYKRKDYDFSVSRAYYTMFYCAESLLLTKDMSFSKHSAVIAAFGKHFSKPKILSPELHSYLINAYKDRQIGDYEVIKEITNDQAQAHLRNAKEFLKQTIKYLKEMGYEL